MHSNGIKSCILMHVANIPRAQNMISKLLEFRARSRGMLTACVLEATKSNVKEMLTSLAASKKQVMLILSTHGGMARLFDR